MVRPTSLIQLLQDLVAIPSVNPAGNPGTDRVGEKALADYVSSFLLDLGAEVKLDFIEPGRPNVIATFLPDTTPEAHLAFAPHLDTVSVAGMTISPFDPVIKGERLYGRGATDTKGPMAAALWAIQEWAQSEERAKSKIQWTFLALMGEEAGNDGAHAMARQKFQADLTVVLEPTDLGVVTAHKGALWLEITTTGLACHGSTPDKGKNAIYAMRRVLQVVEESLLPHLAKIHHPKLGCATLNSGTVCGGSKINIVPDFCRLELDCRILPGTEAESFCKWMEHEVQKYVPESKVHLQRFSPPLDTDESLSRVKQLGAMAHGFTTAPWFSDAAILGNSTSPAVCLGPGLIAQAHTKDEYILLADLEAGYQLFRQWMKTS